MSVLLAVQRAKERVSVFSHNTHACNLLLLVGYDPFGVTLHISHMFLIFFVWYTHVTMLRDLKPPRARAQLIYTYTLARTHTHTPLI